MRAARLAVLSLSVLLSSFALVFGLTYLPCWSAICVEKHFAYPVRIHLLSFYACTCAFLLVYLLRGRSQRVRNALGTLVSNRPVPLTSTYVSWGGLLQAVWLVGFVGAGQGYFWGVERTFYRDRALREAGTTLGTTRLALVGSTGHVCDLLLGAMIMPVTRDGVLTRVFGFEVSTLLRFHKLVGYLFFLSIWIHMIPFYAWVPVFATAELPLKNVFAVDNPTMSQTEVEENYYYATVLATGMLGLIIFCAIVITSLPKLRRMSYNTFYYTHLLSIVFFILVCLHASTDFYILLPGLLLWLVDWFFRFRGLGTKVCAKLQKEGNGWFKLEVCTADLPESTLRCLEQNAEWPLKHFYLNVPHISRFQNHPFTAATGLGSNVKGQSPRLVWLFRVPNLGKEEKKVAKEWTFKLSKMLESSSEADLESESVPARGLEADAIRNTEAGTVPNSSIGLLTRNIQMRIEGPYITPHAPFQRFRSVLCVVGGTGITGALSLAECYVSLRSQQLKATKVSTKSTKDDGFNAKACITTEFTIVWSVRATEHADLVDVKYIRDLASANGVSINFVTHRTGSGYQRLDFDNITRQFVERGALPSSPPDLEKVAKPEEAFHSGWVYLSGPSGLMYAGDRACTEVRRARNFDVGRLDWYCAKWDV